MGVQLDRQDQIIRLANGDRSSLARIAALITRLPVDAYLNVVFSVRAVVVFLQNNWRETQLTFDLIGQGVQLTGSCEVKAIISDGANAA